MKKFLPSRRTLVDVVERTAATFAQAFLGVLIANGGHTDQLTSLKIGGTAGALAVAKYLLVKANAFLATSSAA